MKKPEISETTYEDVLPNKRSMVEGTKEYDDDIKIMPGWIRAERGVVWVTTTGYSIIEKNEIKIDTKKASNFYFYRDRWKKETSTFSSPVSIRMNRNYQKIIGLGEPIIPLIIIELQREPDDWFYALEMLVNDEDNPTTKDMGFNDSINAWLNWGKNRNYI